MISTVFKLGSKIDGRLAGGRVEILILIFVSIKVIEKEEEGRVCNGNEFNIIHFVQNLKRSLQSIHYAGDW